MTEILKCNKCGQELVQIIFDAEDEFGGNDLTIKVNDRVKSLSVVFQVVNCIKCNNGGSNKSSEFPKSATIGTFSERYILEDYETDIENDTILSKMKLVKA